MGSEATPCVKLVMASLAETENQTGSSSGLTTAEGDRFDNAVIGMCNVWRVGSTFCQVSCRGRSNNTSGNGNETSLADHTSGMANHP